MSNPAIRRTGLAREPILGYKGANVNDKDKKGLTAVYYATLFNQEKTIKILIKNGADLNVKDKDGYSPFDIAEIANYKPAVEILKAAGGK